MSIVLIIISEHASVVVKRLRLAGSPGSLETAESQFRLSEIQVHEPAGGLIDIRQQRTSRRPAFKPALVAIIDPDQFADA